ncbi:MAG TPA: twin-arginine translocation signal domain-containing protein [Candidatus Acidoferrum sp.]|jgi:hypothetical protein|nr:twin-arginine translocation signal domain-containing protein [Candidatus Acidoferrum sp.]
MLRQQNHDEQVRNSGASAPADHGAGSSRLGRRSFLKRAGLGGAALLPTTSLLIGHGTARADVLSGGLGQGDVAILRLLAAAEILESDLWQQYQEISLGNSAFIQAIQALDGDMPTYVRQNTRDEFSHAAFINSYLMAKGHQAVSLEQFRRLPSSQATGSNKTAKRLTNLMNLTVDTSWYLRYRSAGNPDFGDTFPQIVNLVNVPGIPNSDLPAGGDDIQVIANTAGFHFATIEQGGSSLYDSLLPKATSREVVRIIASIGGTEIQHFELWQDKAGNAPPVPAATATRFPQLPVAPSVGGVTFFPGDGTDPASPEDTNQVFPFPCTFISPHLKPCAVIRPTSTKQAGAVAAFNGFVAMGLFQGQQDDFFDFVFELAGEADEAGQGF